MDVIRLGVIILSTDVEFEYHEQTLDDKRFIQVQANGVHISCSSYMGPRSETFVKFSQLDDSVSKLFERNSIFAQSFCVAFFSAFGKRA